MHKKYQVRLTPSERDELGNLVRAGTAPAAAITHARILLKADIAKGAPGWKDEQISDAFDISVRTIVRVRQDFVYRGLANTIYRKKPSGPPSRTRKLDGQLEAHLIALVCSPPPEGRARWSVRLLSDEFVKLEEVSELGLESISRETIRQTLKKTKRSLG